MTQNNDINSTNGAPKEYWEARAQNEREQAKSVAFARRIGKTMLLIFGGSFLLIVIFWVIILSI